MATQKLAEAVPAPRPDSLAAVSHRDDAVVLGPVLPNDHSSLFIWMNDMQAARLDFTWRPLDYVAFRAWMDRMSQDQGQVLFAIRKLDAAEIAGFVILKNIQAVHRSADLGVRIGLESDRGKGLGTRAVRLALNYAWNTLNLNRVALTVLADNSRAIASYKQCGFIEEGRLRQASFMDGRWTDVLIMAALRPDNVRPLH